MIIKFLRKMHRQLTLSIVLKAIEQANDMQISEIIRAVIRRYDFVFPDWDVFFLSLPKEPIERRSQLEHMLEHLKDHDSL